MPEPQRLTREAGEQKRLTWVRPGHAEAMQTCNPQSAPLPADQNGGPPQQVAHSPASVLSPSREQHADNLNLLLVKLQVGANRNQQEVELRSMKGGEVDSAPLTLKICC